MTNVSQKAGQKNAPELNERASAIGLPSASIRQSIRMVENWMDDCNAAVGFEDLACEENLAVVSTMSGAYQDRPKLDVGVWQKQTDRKINMTAFNLDAEKRSSRLQHSWTGRNARTPDNSFEEFEPLLVAIMPEEISSKKKVSLLDRALGWVNLERLDKDDKPRRTKSDGATQSHQGSLRRMNLNPVVRSQRGTRSTNDAMADSQYPVPPKSNPNSRSDTNLKSTEFPERVDRVAQLSAAPSFLSSRESAVNLGSILESPPEWRIVQPSIPPRPRTLSFEEEDSFRPSPPRPNSNPRYSNGQTDSTAVANPLSSKQLQSLPPTPTSLDRPGQVSDFDGKRERRRAERGLTVPTPPSSKRRHQKRRTDRDTASGGARE